MIKNLTIILSKEAEFTDAFVFSCEDEIFKILTGVNKNTSDLPKPTGLIESFCLTPNQTIAAV